MNVHPVSGSPADLMSQLEPFAVNIPKQQVYERLIDAYRLWIDDCYVWRGENIGLYAQEDPYPEVSPASLSFALVSLSFLCFARSPAYIADSALHSSSSSSRRRGNTCRRGSRTRTRRRSLRCVAHTNGQTSTLPSKSRTSTSTTAAQ